MHDLACVVHLHSLYSDGTGTVSEIAAAARTAGVDVVLLTDHDTLAARDRGEEGWHGGVLVIVGEEVSPSGRDHFLAFGLERPVDHEGLDSAGICAAVSAAGGFGFAAHPFSRGSERFRRARGIPWKDLDCAGLEGIELWSFVTDTAERLPSLGAALRFAVSPGTSVDHPPTENLAAWDRLCRERRMVAIGGLDAHQFGKRLGPVVVRLMGYRRSFRHLRTHVLVDEPLRGDLESDRERVLSALRGGRCYLAMDSVAPARGFRFEAEGPEGTLAMGAEAPAGDWTLRVTAPRPAHVRLLRDGEEVVRSHTATLSHRAERAGVYRVEARLRARGAERTWVVTNPIYLR